MTTRPVRVGATMRRPRHARSAYVDALLQHLAGVGFTGVPAPLGYDDQDRQMLTWIEGEVCDGGGPYLLADVSIATATTLIRGFHDATAGFEPGGVSHGDLGPHNTVFRDRRAVAIIDFDEDVGPGSQLDDFAQAVWGFADLTSADVAVAEQARKTRLMCDVYGGVTPHAVVTALTGQFRRARDRHRASGLGGAEQVFEDLLTWLARHGGEIVRS